MKASLFVIVFLLSTLIVVVVTAVGSRGQRRKEDHYHHYHHHRFGRHLMEGQDSKKNHANKNGDNDYEYEYQYQVDYQYQTTNPYEPGEPRVEGSIQMNGVAYFSGRMKEKSVKANHGMTYNDEMTLTMTTNDITASNFNIQKEDDDYYRNNDAPVSGGSNASPTFPSYPAYNSNNNNNYGGGTPVAGGTGPTFSGTFAPMILQGFPTVSPVTSEPLIPSVSIMPSLTPMAIPTLPAPVLPTPAPVSATPAPLPPTVAPLPPTVAPISPTLAPLPPSPAPIPPTIAPLLPSRAPIPPTIAPLPPSQVPIPPTIAPFPPSPVPIDRDAIMALLASVAPDRGASFADSNSYQSKALSFILTGLSSQTDAATITYYALACIWYATSGVANAATMANGAPVTLWTRRGGWATNSNYCSWLNVTCAGIDVDAIELVSNNLLGSFPSEAQLLKKLRVLDLFGNEFLYNDGALGNDFLGNMTSLQFLYYGSTSFSFPGIPSAIGKLTNLIEYDCSFSLYNGPIPDIFGPLKKLNYLDLSDNDWLGNGIPSSLIALPNLEFFYFENVFTDATLNFLVGMPKILEFWADFTSWGSTIPSGIGLVKTLQSLSLTFCELQGTIPTEFATLPLLKQVWLYQNSLTGAIPPALANAPSLQVLQVEGNNVMGAMPSEICVKQSSTGLFTTLGSDCERGGKVTCGCCSCCGATNCGNFLGKK